ncbi:MAG: lipase family protein [Candidatus Nomurabacteria bacterium]|jgi:hypothetical protein|nr:lipase family protein [Candidatus Nomurabacteria bacterium]
MKTIKSFLFVIVLVSLVLAVFPQSALAWGDNTQILTTDQTANLDWGNNGNPNQADIEYYYQDCASNQLVIRYERAHDCNATIGIVVYSYPYVSICRSSEVFSDEKYFEGGVILDTEYMAMLANQYEDMIPDDEATGEYAFDPEAPLLISVSRDCDDETHHQDKITISEAEPYVDGEEITEQPDEATSICLNWWYDTLSLRCLPKQLTLNWDSKMLLADSSLYNSELKKIAMAICGSIYNGNIRELLGNLGFGHIEEYSKDTNDRAAKGVAHTAHYWISSQKINGVDYVTVDISGTEGESEWLSNLGFTTIQPDSPIHKGFESAAEWAEHDLKWYCLDEENDIDVENAKFLITGHSRGAAVGNILATKLNETYGAENVFAYTFATPNTYNLGGVAPEANNIFNIVDADDLVQGLPPKGTKAGTTLGYASNALATAAFYNISTKQLAADFLLSSSLPMPERFWQHSPDNYIARVFSDEPTLVWNGLFWNYVQIHCPVDVIIRSGDEIVASVIGGEVYNKDEVFAFVNDEGEKDFLLPADKKYDIELIPTDDGEMDYSASQFQPGVSDSYVEIVSRPAIAIKGGKKLEASIDGSVATPPEEVATSDKDLPFEAIIIIVLVAMVAVMTVIRLRRRN